MSKQPHRARNLSIGSSTQLCPIVLITPEGEAFIGKRYPGAFVWIDPDQYIREVAGDDNTEKEKAMRAMLSKALETARQDKVAATAAKKQSPGGRTTAPCGSQRFTFMRP